MLDNENTSKEEGGNSAITMSTRRKFLKKASIGAPIIIATSTKPAWGVACLSGMMSGNLSNHEHTCDLTGGLSHGHWKNHWTGKKKQHFKNNDIEKALKNKFTDYFKHYYVKDGQTHHFSTFKKNSELGGVRFQYLLNNGTRFEREIVTAFISASMNDSIVGFYPYTVVDVDEIYTAVEDGTANESDVATMLENIHKGAVQPD